MACSGQGSSNPIARPNGGTGGVSEPPAEAGSGGNDGGTAGLGGSGGSGGTAGLGGSGGSGGSGGTPPEPRCPAFAAAGAGGAGDADEADHGCLTTDVPVGPFLIDSIPYADAEGQVDESQFDKLGPWLVTFRTLGPGRLACAIVSTESSLWAKQGPEADAFELMADARGVYRLPSRSTATLATFAYTWDRVPGVCLHRNSADDDLRPDAGSEFRFYDANGDGAADALTLSGTAVTLGLRGGDYDNGCGGDVFPLKTRGKVVDQRASLSVEGDALHSRLLIEGGFLKEGSAKIRGQAAAIQAKPMALAGIIHGFASPVVLEPGSPLDWRVDGVDLLGRPVRNGSADLGVVSLGRVEPWLLVTDGGFENLDEGQRWGDGPATAEAKCCGEDEGINLPPIVGKRSLHIHDSDGGGSRFRFTRSTNQTLLSFVAFGSLSAEVGVVGQAPKAVPEGALESCDDYPGFCTVNGGAPLKYVVDIGAAPGDVLLSIQDHSAQFGGGSDSGVWLDELRVE